MFTLIQVSYLPCIWFILIFLHSLSSFSFIHYVHIDSGLLPTLYLIYFNYHRIFLHSLCSHWFRSLTYLVSDLFWLSSYFPLFMFTLFRSLTSCIWFILIIIVLFTLIQVSYLPCIWFIQVSYLPCIWFILIIIVFSFIHYVHIDSGLLPTLYLIYL